MTKRDDPTVQPSAIEDDALDAVVGAGSGADITAIVIEIPSGPRRSAASGDGDSADGERS